MGHDHGQHASSRRLAFALGLTATVLVAEIIGAWWTGSLALATDAGHMLVDSAGLVIALIAARLALRPRSKQFTWGLARMEVVSAALQAGILLAVCIIVTVEAISRLREPHEVLAREMAVFAVIGLLANIIAMFVLHSQRDKSLNVKAAFLEVANDALGSVAVLVAAGIIAFTGWQSADPIASLCVAALMGPRAIKMLGMSIGILLERTPDGLDLDDVRDHILSLEHVIDVHDLHASLVATGTIALTAHVTLQEECFSDGHSVEVLHQLEDCLAEHFPISVTHCTFQLDPPQHRDHERLTHMTS